MRVLYVTNYQGPAAVSQRGQRRNRALGAERKIALIAAGLSRAGHHVDLVSAATVSEGTCRLHPGFRCQEPECDGAEVIYLPALDVPRLNLVFAARELRRFLRRAPAYDAVLLYNLEWYFLRPVAEHADQRRCALVLEYEDDALTLIGARFRRWHLDRGRRAIALAREKAHGVVAVSPELARQLGLENSAVVPGVVGDDLACIVRRGQGEPSAPLRLVYTGGITRPKGPDLLLAAVDQLPFPVEVDILGAGQDLAALRARAPEARWPVRVRGEVSREEMVTVLARADLAVNPHRFTEGERGQVFPFKVVEYIGSGLPVVTSRFGEFPLPLTDSLVSYDRHEPSALATAISQAQERLPALRAAARTARAWVCDQYSTAGVARTLVGLLEQATVRRRGSC